jgi:ABC-type branched-subunit amino acid transport system substrate-binding protein
VKQIRLFAVLLAFVLVVAACSSDDSGDDTTTTAAAETTTTAAGGEETTTTTAATTEAPMEIATDVGVDLEAGVIKIGLLTDLTGVFSFLVQGIVDAYTAYWEQVNDSGGINGMTVEVEVFDTSYAVDQTVIGYEELKDEVVAFGHSVGSPNTVAIQPDLEADGILAIPLTWYSGWTDPAFNSNIIHHGTPYCIEAMNILDFLVTDMSVGTDIAILSLPGDYGLDSAAGAALGAAALGMNVVLDLSGGIIPGEDMKPLADQIVAADPDIVFVTTEPNLTFPALYQEVIAQGFQAVWTGAAPTYSPQYLQSDFATEIERDWYGFFYSEPWGGESAGAQAVRDLMAEYRPDAQPLDYYGEAVVEATILHRGLERAMENGDMTQAGVLAAVKSFEALDFNGLAPPEKYTGTPDEQLQRVGLIYKPEIADQQAGGSGTVVVETDYSGPTAQAFVFEEACFSL